MEAHAASIESRLQGAVAALAAAQRQLVALTHETAESGAWAGPGLRSLTHWLTWRAGVSPTTAAQLVRVAAAVDTHPALTASFERGELTLDQMAVAVTAPAHHDGQMAALSPLCTVGQIRTLVRAASAPPVGVEPEADSAREYVAVTPDDDGGGRVAARLHADRYAIVDAAISAARDRLAREGTGAVTLVDALIDVCERSFDAETTVRRERFKPVLHIDPKEPVPARWPSGIAVPDAIRQYVTCDGWLTPSFTDGARPVSVGRTLRIVPDRTRRTVQRRDKECRMPWCHRTHGLEIHHIIHWEDGGPSDTWNLLASCRRCHRRHHLGEFSIAGNADDPDGLMFTDAHGHVLRPSGPPPAPPPTGERPPPYRHPLGERLDRSQLFFDARPPNAA